MENKSATKEGDVIRHCAYCLNVCGLPIKLCGGCKRRAYCSKECQRADWSIKGNGQRHINWCRRHECGEEDVDWKVVPIPNKGLGVRAKKLIPAGMKIIVEPVFNSPDGHPGIKELGPEGETLEDKFGKNLFTGENMDEENMDEEENEKVIALRIARVNHSCQPNAATIYDETARVAVLFAQKDIQPGEEISICYYAGFFLLSPLDQRIGIDLDEELRIFKNQMASHYGITCTNDCYCNDSTIRALNLEGRQMYATVETLTRQYKFEEALAAGDKLLDIYRRLNASWIYRCHAEYLLFRIAVCKSDTLTRANNYIRSVVELLRKICPYSERKTKKYEKLLEHPETDPNYMRIDRNVASFIGHLLSGLN